jgi:hypothetical protein
MAVKTKFFTIILVFIVACAITVYFVGKKVSFSGMVATVSLPETKTTKYTIDSIGVNPRVYEWDTKSGYHCVALFRDESGSAAAMQCFKK